MRELQRARDRAEPAVRLQEAIEAGDHLLGRRARRERERDVVEAALHVEGGGERCAVHPEHAEALVVRHQLARPDAVDVLGRQRDADDREPAQPAVDDRADAIAGARGRGR